jgi:tetratricopeptide (TPR) repeat protein
MEELCKSGVQAMQGGEVQKALHSLFRVLSLRPREGRVWFFVGYILCIGVQEPERFSERANASIKLKDVSISDERYKELLQAEQAFKLACVFNPELVEARVQLASCYLLLNRPHAVVECVEQVFQQRPNRADTYSLLSQVLLGVGDLRRAAMAAREALELDPEDPLARRTLSILESAFQRKENEE